MKFDQDPTLRPVNMDFYRHSYVSGQSQPGRLRIRYYFRPADGRLFASIGSGQDAAGPPGLLHGGAMSAILDEAMGVMAWFNHHPVVTANLNVDFKLPLPLGLEAELETWIERHQGRKVYTYGELRSAKGLHASASGLFIRMNMDAFGEHQEPIRRQYGF